MVQKQLDALGQDIFESRYAYPGEKKWNERTKVIAKVAASPEPDSDKEKYGKAFNDIMATGDFVPGGRIIFGAGRRNQGLMNCFVLQPDDSVPSIKEFLGDIYTISCAGGGIGVNFSKIRPRGDDIANIKNSAPGSVELMRLVDKIGDHVRAGKSRRAALLATLEVTHPDLMDFLFVKLEKGELTNFNISVSITDRFLEAVEADEDWYFVFNNKKYHPFVFKRISEDGQSDEVTILGFDEEDALGRAKEQYRRHWNDTFDFVRRDVIKAKTLWNTIWENSVISGEPGILNIDFANSYTNVSYFSKLVCVNPCGELWLENGEACCLGNINLANMVLEDGTDLDWKRLAKSIRLGVRFLDNILTVNTYPLDKCKKTHHNTRRIGLGVMGLHYMLIKLNLIYGSNKCLEFLERLFTTIRDEAYMTSMYLSRDKSPFPAFESKAYLKEQFAKTLPARIRMLIKRYGIRNATLLTIPPTGTTSMLMGVSTGIEPIFSAMYKRRYREGNVLKETVVVDPMFKQWYEDGKPLDSFVGAYDVSPEDHIRVQATIQKCIDSSLSKSINLPKDYQDEKLADMIFDYIPYLKGLTLYKAGSRENEPLEAIPLTQDNVTKYMVDIDTEKTEEAVADGTVCSLTGGGCG
tara:strand:+ start:361 stop:2268 length:1908 start_codon:yes stop_codon:yes gene_type:complete